MLPIQSLRKPEAPSIQRWWWLLVSALGGAFATFTGFRLVSANLGAFPETGRLQMFYAGMFEANAAHFIAFSCGALLCLSILLVLHDFSQTPALLIP